MINIICLSSRGSGYFPPSFAALCRFFHQGTQHGCIPLANCAQKPRFSWCSGNCLVILQAGLGQISAMTCNVPLRLEMPGLNLVRLWMKKYEVVPGSSHCWDAILQTSSKSFFYVLAGEVAIRSWAEASTSWGILGLLSTSGEGWKRHSGLFSDLVLGPCLAHIFFPRSCLYCNCYSSCKCIVCLQTVVKQLLVRLNIPNH